MNEMINVLDRGYVRLTNVMGSDLSVVNSARVSYDKESTELTEKDVRLIKFLAREGHTSPFRHATLQFEVYAPLMVARQHFKYLVGSSFQEPSGDNMMAWNESSRRYVTEEPTFYIPQPDEWRSAPENSKQGSGEPVEFKTGFDLTVELAEYIEQGERLYNEAMAQGVAAEQARLFLPAYGMYVRYYWTASLQSVAHFVNQRLAHDAQAEIQAYADAVYRLAKEKFPVSIGELVKTEGA
ncbi:FAD-dependent thymidylate synthase [Heyndrickxia sporothermodurans]|uniref:FAD-dependent thymidylate synthase n=1 Tax=Heyndrickxia sporothermodurans TaxID=46224 RepID=UPI002E1E0470|nr:FAD-dependent thymidylate synthase [Heyndrickxia sporothermodurans]MED3697960.1 FAD-dependent thymidylate synthase [Heyndrickxia sporothermodurans]